MGCLFLGILEFLEIASVALLPRNDAWNSKFICDEILWSSRGITQGLGILEFCLGILDFF